MSRSSSPRSPRKPVYSDIQLGWSIPVHAAGSAPIVFQALEMDTVEATVQIATIKTGYLVTGGGREPYYGCTDCIPSADELPPGRWRLLKEFPGPTHPTRWRREPARVWEAVSPGALGRRSPSPVIGDRIITGMLRVVRAW